MSIEKAYSIIRYLLIIGSIILMFFNLFNCIIKSLSLVAYLITVGTFLLYILLLVFIQSNIVIIWVIYVIASITMISDNIINYLSYSIIFFILLIFLNRSLLLRLVIYFTTLIITVCSHVFISSSNNADLASMLLGYSMTFALGELVYYISKEQIRKDYIKELTILSEENGENII